MLVKKVLFFSALVMIVTGLFCITNYFTNYNVREKRNSFSTQENYRKEEKTKPISETDTSSNESLTAPKKTESNKTNGNNTSDLNLWRKFKPICQYPELPNGCEITSLTMVLYYNGYHFKKENLSDKYLDKGEVGTVDFREAFEGDPRDSNSYGCYAPVIVNTANKYLRAKESKLKALDISETDFNELFNYTDAGIPVIIWCTYELKQGHFSVTWHVNDRDLTWYTPEHCMVLLGQKGDNAITADPAYGEIKVYSKRLLEKRYNELFKQAVIIQ